MKTYAVYRLGYWNNKLELMGRVVERRKEERKTMRNMCDGPKKFTQLRRSIQAYSSSKRVPLRAYIRRRIGYPQPVKGILQAAWYLVAPVESEVARNGSAGTSSVFR